METPSSKEIYNQNIGPESENLTLRIKIEIRYFQIRVETPSSKEIYKTIILYQIFFFWNPPVIFLPDQLLLLLYLPDFTYLTQVHPKHILDSFHLLIIIISMITQHD